jgi:hypothetical protein
MAFATISLFGATNSAGGYLQESSEETSIEIATCKDQTGVTKVAVPKGMKTTTVTLKGKGTYTSFAVARNTDVGATAVITSAKVTETNDDFADYEITYQSFASN